MRDFFGDLLPTSAPDEAQFGGCWELSRLGEFRCAHCEDEVGGIGDCVQLLPRSCKCREVVEHRCEFVENRGEFSLVQLFVVQFVHETPTVPGERTRDFDLAWEFDRQFAEDRPVLGVVADELA